MTRRTRQELRNLMIDAGVELVRDRGLAFDPPTLNYATVFNHLEETRGIRLHRSQVHGRIWPDQEAFRLEVIVETIVAAAPATAEVDELIEELGDSSEIQLTRTQALDALAAAIEATHTSAAADRGFDLFVAAQGLSTSGTATPVEVTDAVRSNLSSWMQYNEQRFHRAAALLGQTPGRSPGVDPDDAFSLLARSAGALSEGGRLLEAIDDELGRTFDMLDLGGTSRTLDTATMALTLIVEDLFDLGSNDAESSEPSAGEPPTPTPDDQPRAAD